MQVMMTRAAGMCRGYGSPCLPDGDRAPVAAQPASRGHESVVVFCVPEIFEMILSDAILG